MTPVGLPYWQGIVPPDAISSGMKYVWDELEDLPGLLRQAAAPRDWHRINSIIKDVKIVAKKPDNGGSGSERNPAQNKSVEWINITLSEKDVEVLIHSPWTGDECIDGICALVSEGATITIKPDGRSDGFACYAVIPGRDDKSPNIGLAGYGSNADDALRSFLFKYYVAAAGNIQNRATGKSRFG